MRARHALALIALIAGCVSAPPATVPSPTPAVPPAPLPTATPLPPMPSAVPTVPPPAAMPSRDIEPPLIRVLLQRSTAAVEMPQPGRAYRLSFEGRTAWLWGPLRLRVAKAGPRWWQVGAWAEPANASAAADRIRRAIGTAVEVVEEPANRGLIRVRVGWSSAEPAEPESELAAVGFDGIYPVPAPGVLRVEGTSGGVVTSGDEVLIEAWL